MRPEHSEVKAKIETRVCETKTETKKLLWYRDQTLRDWHRDRDRDQSSQFNWVRKLHKLVKLPFLSVSCHVGKLIIWRTTVKEETSTLQNVQDIHLPVYMQINSLYKDKYCIFNQFLLLIGPICQTHSILLGFKHFVMQLVYCMCSVLKMYNSL